jgi:hypothetical protein
LANCHQIERRTGLVMNKRLERGKIESLIVFPLSEIFFNGGLNLSIEMSQNGRANALKFPSALRFQSRGPTTLFVNDIHQNVAAGGRRDAVANSDF